MNKKNSAEYDSKRTLAVRALPKDSPLYLRWIAPLLGKTYNKFKILEFHDVHTAKYRFLCKCLKCTKEQVHIGTVIKRDRAACGYCIALKQEGKRKKIAEKRYGIRDTRYKGTPCVVHKMHYHSRMRFRDHLFLLGNMIFFVCIRAHLLWLLSGYSWGFSLVNSLISLLGAFMIFKASRIEY